MCLPAARTDYRMVRLGTLALPLEHMHFKHASMTKVVELPSILTYSTGLSDLDGTTQLYNLPNSENKALLY